MYRNKHSLGYKRWKKEPWKLSLICLAKNKLESWHNACKYGNLSIESYESDAWYRRWKLCFFNKHGHIHTHIWLWTWKQTRHGHEQKHRHGNGHGYGHSTVYDHVHLRVPIRTVSMKVSMLMSVLKSVFVYKFIIHVYVRVWLLPCFFWQLGFQGIDMDMGHRQGQGQDKVDQTLQKNKSILSDEIFKK